MDSVLRVACGTGLPAAMLVVGLTLALRGVRRCGAALPRPRSGAMQPLIWMRGFRMTLVGIAVAAAGAAWLWHLGWLLALAVAIGGEETLETSIAIAALRAQRASMPSSSRSH